MVGVAECGRAKRERTEQWLVVWFIGCWFFGLDLWFFPFSFLVLILTLISAVVQV